MRFMADERKDAKQRAEFEKAARELECDESNDALDKAAGRVLKPHPPEKQQPEKEKSAE